MAFQIAEELTVGDPVSATVEVSVEGDATLIPVGSVTIFDDDVEVGAGVLTDGSATIEVTVTEPGVRNLVAVYEAEHPYADSESAGVSFEARYRPAIAVDIPAAVFGQNVDATVSVTSPDPTAVVAGLVT
ncbi:MAG: Ig-like domain-containing protein, partial [Microthrixaceae bacterium]